MDILNISDKIRLICFIIIYLTQLQVFRNNYRSKIRFYIVKDRKKIINKFINELLFK